MSNENIIKKFNYKFTFEEPETPHKKIGIFVLIQTNKQNIFSNKASVYVIP